MKPVLSPLQLVAAAAVVFLGLPLVALVVTAPWPDMVSRLGDPGLRSAVGLSLATAAAATVLAGVVGVPLGWVLARDPSWRWLRPLVLVPLVLPPVVAGHALQQTFGREGLLGGLLEAAFGIVIPFSATAVVLAQAFVALPFCVLAVESGVRAMDPRHEELARVYAITGYRQLRRVTLPLVGPGIRIGLVMAFARALGEFGATLVFAGNLPGRTQTMPLAVFLGLQGDPAAAALLSLLLVAASLGLVLTLRGRLRVLA